jgi:hypothetical protein
MASTWINDIEKEVTAPAFFVTFRGGRTMATSYSLFINCYKIVDGETVEMAYEALRSEQISTGFTIRIDENAKIDYIAFPVL